MKSSSMSPKYVVTLVHGTWARKAEWAKYDSEMCKMLRARLGADIVIKTFPWSGRNTHKARQKAIAELSDALEGRLRHYPNSKHYIVSHSHGGNIALLAVSDAQLNEQIAGIVCMSTPFMSARERDLGSDPFGQIAGAIVGLMFIFYFLIGQIPFPDFGIGVPRGLIEFTLGVFVFCGLAGLSMLWQKFSKRLLFDLDMGRNNRVRVFADKTFRDKVLIIRSPSDEASAALSLCQFICQISVRLYLRAYTAYRRTVIFVEEIANYRSTLLRLAGFAFVLVLILLVVEHYVPIAQETPQIVERLFLGIVILLGVTTIVSLGIAFIGAEYLTVFFRIIVSVLVWPVIFLLSLFLLPFGWEIALANLMVDVSAESTPPGSWNVHLVEPTTSRERGQEIMPLMHSVIYDDPRALRVIGDWMSNSSSIDLSLLSQKIKEPGLLDL